MTLAARDVVVAYAGRPALHGISLTVPLRKTLAVVGPSGAGKTTLLRALAGLHPLQSGNVSLQGVDVHARPPQERRIAMVFQDDVLFAHMSVRSNLRFALRTRRPGSERAIENAAAALHVEALLDRKPRQISGGERQRASMARALLSEPVALLMDEPLAHLDPSLRRSVRDEVVGLRQRFDGPIVYVTHDHAEAMTVGDELAVLIEGRIEDRGEPQRVYDAPRTLAVARFLGDRPMNVFRDGNATLGIRPERVVLCKDGQLSGRVVRRESTGADAYVVVATARGDVTARISSADAPPVGETAALSFPEAFVRRFDAAGVAVS